MTDTNEPKKGEEIDFMSRPSMQKAVIQSKRKQTIKYVFIAVLTTIILLTIIFGGSQFILTKRIENQDSLYNSIHGANISDGGTTYNHNIFSITKETTYRKTIDDRSILWDKKTEKIPLFGKIDTLEKGSGKVEINTLNEDAKRYVHYNDFNNERKIDFYYPGLTYDYLPQELNTAVNLDNNMLIEVALSFKEPMTLSELAKKLGKENVNWLWVDTTTATQMERMERNLDKDSLKTKGGEGAFGFQFTPELPYSEENGQRFINILEELNKKGIHKSSIKGALEGIKENTQATKGKIRINGAVITGTAMELKRFQSLGFIRASVLGATIDKY